MSTSAWGGAGSEVGEEVEEAVAADVGADVAAVLAIGVGMSGKGAVAPLSLPHAASSSARARPWTHKGKPLTQATWRLPTSGLLT